jgi:hypothetical protein
MTDWTDDDELRLSIEMALRKIKTKPKGPQRDGIHRRMVAQQIVDHVTLSNWRFPKGPPRQPHGQPRKP